MNDKRELNRIPELKTFTMIELLIVFAILLILISLFLPVLKKARGAAGVSVCLSNLKQHGFAISSYSDDFEGWIPAHMEPGISQYPTLPGHIVKYAGGSWKIKTGKPLECGILKCVTDTEKYPSNLQLAKFSNVAGYFQNWTPGTTKSIRTSYSESNSFQALGGFFGWNDESKRKLYKVTNPSRIYMFSEGRRSILYGPSEYNFSSHEKGVTMVFADGHSILKSRVPAVAEYWVHP